jgi:hypothetical protein
MKIFPILALTLLAHAAWADDFTARAIAGRAASATSAGSKFDDSLLPILGKAGAFCDPSGTKLPATELGQFVLVGDVTPQGKLINIVVKPENPVSQCFAAQLAHNAFDAPPRPDNANYPIVVQLNVTN